jgi:hypothetical protein
MDAPRGERSSRKPGSKTEQPEDSDAEKQEHANHAIYRDDGVLRSTSLACPTKAGCRSRSFAHQGKSAPRSDARNRHDV